MFSLPPLKRQSHFANPRGANQRQTGAGLCAQAKSAIYQLILKRIEIENRTTERTVCKTF